MRRTSLFTPLLLATFVAAGCESITDPNVATTRIPQAAVVSRGVSMAQLRLPAGARIVDQFALKTGERVINPSDYVCPATTDVTDWWLDAALAFRAAEPAIFQLLYNDLLADVVVTYHALLFETTATPQYFGYKGEYTKVVNKVEKDVKKFWDINSAGIQVVGMHGTVLQNTAKVAATYEAVFGVPPADAAILAAEVRGAVLQSTVLNGGNHPLFSFNAFAASFGGGIPDKIVMGDAVMVGYDVLGFGDVAPQAIFAHEFAHHIQFQKGYFNDPIATTGTVPEQTRYTELMADAYSAYYLTHKRGQGMRQERVKQFLQVFYQIGDCAFTSDGHHGTPNQRMKAAVFGFGVAALSQWNGNILTSDQFHKLFVAVYPFLIRPDAP